MVNFQYRIINIEYPISNIQLAPKGQYLNNPRCSRAVKCNTQITSPEGVVQPGIFSCPEGQRDDHIPKCRFCYFAELPRSKGPAYKPYSGGVPPAKAQGPFCAGAAVEGKLFCIVRPPRPEGRGNSSSYP
jgi:hypothetical protein